MSKRQTIHLLGMLILAWPISAQADPDFAFAIRAVDAPTATETVTTLPAPLESVVVGQVYYLELWVSDVGTINTGVTAAYVDLLFEDPLVTVVTIDHGTIFVVLLDGTVGDGMIDELGGMTYSAGVGIEPEWARVAVVEMDATGEGQVTYALAPSSTGCAAYGRGLIDWVDIDLSEVAIVLHQPDCNENGVPDDQDIADGTSEDCNTNGVPDECDMADCPSEDPDCADCNGNAILDECDIADGTSADCQPDGVPDECEPDCNNNGIADECDITDGTSQDCQPDGVPDECQLTGNDCNTNSIPDECDISWGMSQDCQPNGIPDECELAGGTAQDCNSNGVLDECDIAAGTSEDCNGNDIPDECDIGNGTSDDCQPDGIPDDCEPDCNENGVADECDITSGTSQDCQPDGVPDDCQLAGNDCNSNTVPDECDIASGTSEDCTGNGIPDECDPDCQPNGLADPCEIDLGYVEDCNANGVPDECDIATGASDDCQPNGIPDDCEWLRYRPSPTRGRSMLCQGPTQQAHGGVFMVSVDWDVDIAAAESFTFVEDTRVDTLTWWGTYRDECGGSSEPADDFLVTFLTNETGTADQVLGIYELGGTVQRTPTGQIVPFEAGFPEYEYVAELTSPLAVQGGKRYWVEIRNRLVCPEMWWWETAPSTPPANSTALYDAAGDGYDAGDLVPFDLAFCVSGLPAAQDCNENGIDDSDDIASGSSLDCQGNGVPDECEADRNFNGVPDHCDIIDGISWDTNFNGIPDEADCLTRLGDLDGDCDVDLSDYALFSNCLERCGEDILWACRCADIDANGCVDVADYEAFTVRFGTPDDGCRIVPINPCPDTWTTNSFGETYYDFGGYGPIPAGFFGDGSDAWGDVVTLIGRQADPSGVYGAMDTQIQHEAVEFDPDTGIAETTIDIITLYLVAPDPVIVTYDGGARNEEWILLVRLSRHNPDPGVLIATLDEAGANAGVFEAIVFVQPLFYFIRLQDVIDDVLPDCRTERVLDTGETGPDMPEMPPIVLTFSGQPFVRVVAPHIFEEMSVAPCAQGNFVTGVEQETRGDIRSQIVKCMSHVTNDPDEQHDFCPTKCYEDSQCLYVFDFQQCHDDCVSDAPHPPQVQENLCSEEEEEPCKKHFATRDADCETADPQTKEKCLQWFVLVQDNPCRDPMSLCEGACCITGNGCVMSTQTLCEGPQGSPTGDTYHVGISCVPMGACYLGGECFDTGFVCCNDWGGEFDEGVECPRDPSRKER